jgi:hypothetical protein
MHASAVSGSAPLAAHGDAQLAAIFRQMRAVMGLTVPAVARRVGTDIAVVMDLEAGLIDTLPPWGQTVRIVEAYGHQTGVDPSPILTRLLTLQSPATAKTIPTGPFGAPASAMPPQGDEPSRQQRGPGYRPGNPAAAGSAASQNAASNVAAYMADDDHGQDEAERAASARADRRRRRIRRGTAVGLPMAAVLGIGFMMQSSPQPLYAAANALPSAVKAPVRAGLDYVVLRSAPLEEGLRWIDLGDPRLRKADKLQSAQR